VVHQGTGFGPYDLGAHHSESWAGFIAQIVSKSVLRAEGFVAKSPVSGRPSITASMSLCLAYREDRLQHVADTWQTIAAFPHALIIHTAKSAAFPVMLSAKFAMRTWQATMVSVPHSGECDEGGGRNDEGGDVATTLRHQRIFVISIAERQGRPCHCWQKHWSGTGGRV
jgi:hypothetical protein